MKTEATAKIETTTTTTQKGKKPMSARAEYWVRLLEKHGFATMFGCIFLAMFAAGAQWCGNELLIPMRNEQIKLMQRLGDTTEAQSVTLRNVEIVLGEMSRDQRRAVEGIESMKASLDRASRALEGLGRQECR